MRITLMHNEDAGSSVHLDDITGAIAAHGHEVVQVVGQPEQDPTLLAERPDLVVVSGGDGTVGRAARLLAGSGVPLGILALGTANNVAGALGVRRGMDEVIAGWHDARPVPLDLGIARGPWGECRFLEGVGAGLIAETIAALGDQELRAGRPSSAKVARALRRYRDTLRRLSPAHWSLEVDDEAVDGDYLLVEVLNMPSVGANLLRSQDADPSDGRLSVLLVDESGRDVLFEHIAALLDGADHVLPIGARRARRVLLRGDGRLHVDDDIFVVESGAEPVALHVDEGALLWLGPGSGSD